MKKNNSGKKEISLSKKIDAVSKSVEKLAQATARGFEQTVTKNDLREGLCGLRDEIKNTYATKEELKSEIKNLKDDIEVMLGKYIGTFRKDFDDLAMRVKKLEEKIFR